MSQPISVQDIDLDTMTPEWRIRVVLIKCYMLIIFYLRKFPSFCNFPMSVITPRFYPVILHKTTFFHITS